MKKVWTSLLLILSAAFLLTACADGGQQEEDTGAEGSLPGELAQIPNDYFDETTYLGSPGFLQVFHGFGDHLAHL